jgi:glycerol-3-phosphate acyltransferase PlsY
VSSVDTLTAGGIALYAYALGSIPAAYLVGRLVTGIDVRSEGEGNVGARNVFHQVGPWWGLGVFAIDFGKGAAAAVPFFDGPVWRLAVAGLFLILGHAFPVWLGFVGGKGLAAAGGFGAALMPWAVLIGGAASGIVWLATRRFLPPLVTVVVLAFLTAPLTGVEWPVIGVVLAVFLVVAAKRAVDEPRMRQIEAHTGWDRLRGGTAR